MVSRKEPPTTDTSSVSAIIPSLLFNQFGDCEGATLRPGNVHSADGWQELLEPVAERIPEERTADSCCSGVTLLLPSRSYTSIWNKERSGTPSGCPPIRSIQEQIQPLLERPTDGDSREPIVSYHDFAYQAQSWHLPRRVVLLK